ncbi:MAG: protealysin inhibitor emfourin [Angustibacter sp.]
MSADLAEPAAATRLLDDRWRSNRTARGPGRAVPRAVSAVAAGINRTISDAAGTEQLPGRQVRGEGQTATGDAAVDEAYDGLGATWALYQDVFGRNSLDGAGLPLAATVHYGDRYDNAFWNGDRMVFGDGDGTTFTRFTVAVDVIGHELTHGVIEYSGGLTYQGQSGALNESIADVFGSLVKQRALGQDASSADWLIGAGLFTDAVQGQALRSMKAPGTAYDDPVLGKDPQPATMDDYVQTSDDNGGVHINSGIPNHAFYLAATAIGGNAWEGGAAHVWYETLTRGTLSPDVDFAGFAAATAAVASTRFGADSTQLRAITEAWTRVGLPPTSAPTTGAGSTDEPASSTEDHPEQLLVRRSGGFAGQTLEREVDLRVLPDDQRQAWLRLLSSPTLGELTSEPAQPDRFVYQLQGPRGLDVRVAEQQLPGDVRDLFDRSLQARWPGTDNAGGGR